MNDLVSQFKDLFGYYEPIQNVASVIEDNVNMTETTVYSYSIDWASVAHFAIVVIIFFFVCKCISGIIFGMSKGVSIR